MLCGAHAADGGTPRWQQGWHQRLCVCEWGCPLGRRCVQISPKQNSALRVVSWESDKDGGKYRVRVAAGWFCLGPASRRESRRGRIEPEGGEVSSQAVRAQVRARNPAFHKTGHEQVHVSKGQRKHWFSQGGSGSGWLNCWVTFLALPFLVLKGPRP